MAEGPPNNQWIFYGSKHHHLLGLPSHLPRSQPRDINFQSNLSCCVLLSHECLEAALAGRLDCGVEYSSSPVSTGLWLQDFMGPCFGAALFDDTMKNTTPKEGGLHLGAQSPWVLEEETFQVSLELERKQLWRSGRLDSLGWQTTAEWIWLHTSLLYETRARRHLRALLSLSAADIILERMQWGQAEVNTNELKHCMSSGLFKMLIF